MAIKAAIKGKARFATGALAAAGLALTLPAASLAVVRGDAAVALPEAIGAMPFTPAKMDPQLARKVAALIGEDGLRFTPATKTPLTRDRSVTVAVRVDRETARAISVRSAIEGTSADKGRERALAVASTSYNLGIARGYQSFAQPAKATVAPSLGLRDMGMPDLAAFKPGEDKPSKPSRFGSRLVVEKEDGVGSTARGLSGDDQSVDLSTSYRVVGRVNVTAGVRLSKDSDRLAPLTDGAEDDQSVYVGTRISF